MLIKLTSYRRGVDDGSYGEVGLNADLIERVVKTDANETNAVIILTNGPEYWVKETPETISKMIKDETC